MPITEQDVRALQRKIEQYEYEYYILHTPTIGDVEYDHLLKQLEELEKKYPQWADPNSPTQRVGSDLTSGNRAVQHRVPMLSLANTYTWNEVVDFWENSSVVVGPSLAVVAELKLDGVSISLIYEEGILMRAITRGDGVQGDDVTAAVRAIRSVPLRLRGEDIPPYLEVRGEIVLPWADFNRINAERDQQGLPLFANPRNAVAGTIKQLSPKVVSERRPTIFFYYLLTTNDELLPTSHYDRIALLKKWGLQVSPYISRCEKLQDLKHFIDKWEHDRSNLDIAIDGIVLKVDNYNYYTRLGYTAKYPKWAIAYKYPAEVATSVLRDVTFQVGRTGIVTPVANIDPVQLSGTVVRRASLHNMGIIQSLDLHLGDVVKVEKGGEIIPKITGVCPANKTTQLRPIIMPRQCPICGTPLVKEAHEAGTYCPNDIFCPPQVQGRIEHYASRKAMNINIGPETIKTLYERGLVHNVTDLYELTPDALLGIPLMKDKSIRNLLESIAGTVNVPYRRVLYALGIRYVGETVAALLAQHFTNIDDLITATAHDLLAVDGVGPVIANSVVEYFQEQRHLELIAKLRGYGISFSDETEPIQKSHLFAHKTVVISGTFASMSRDELKQLIVQHGGKIANGITSKTNLFVIGEKVGPSKMAKATLLNIPTLTEAEFFNAYPVLLEDASTLH